MIYFFPWCPTQRDYKRFCYFELQKEVNKIVFVDISKLLNKVYNIDTNNIHHKDTIIVKNFYDLYKLLFTINPTHSFNLAGLLERKSFFRKLFYLYTISNFSKIIEWVGPNIPIYQSLRKTRKTIYSKIRNLFLDLFFKKSDFDYIIGTIAEKNSKAKYKIYAHALDYDLFFNEKNKNTTFTKPEGILFIDSDYVYHPDYKFMGVNSPCTEKKYYPEVNYFLNNISNITKLDVSIQLHPKADQAIAIRNYNYTLSKCDTVEAIKNCKIVVAHDSTAISLAVLYKKPIVLFQTSEIMLSKMHNKLCRNFSEELGLKLFFWDSIVSLKDVFHINEMKYNEYTKKYTKHPSSPVLPSWKILLNSISS